MLALLTFAVVVRQSFGVVLIDDGRCSVAVVRQANGLRKYTMLTWQSYAVMKTFARHLGECVERSVPVFLHGRGGCAWRINTVS